MMISYAQNSEDVMLARVFAGIQNGTYIDVGANHPDIHSVTKHFYEHGWSGINVEPLPSMFGLLMENRPRDTNVNVAVGATSGEVDITHAVDFSGLSSIKGIDAESVKHLGDVRTEKIRVPIVTLNELLQSHPLSEIHFLKIDVEGFEKEVLLGLDLSVTRPWVIVVEATAPLTQHDTSDDWEHLITESGYEFVYHDGLNRFYLANEVAYLAEFFRFPPNIFDDFETAAYVEMRESRDDFAKKYERLRQKYLNYRSGVEHSLSWRITIPIRVAQRLIKRITTRR